jgi:hypothetical protein
VAVLVYGTCRHIFQTYVASNVIEIQSLFQNIRFRIQCLCNQRTVFNIISRAVQIVSLCGFLYILSLSHTHTHTHTHTYIYI